MIDIEPEDLILMLLEGFKDFKHEEEVPKVLTPRMISKVTGIEGSGPYSILKEMKEEELISEHVMDVTGYDRKRNVYFLTDKGRKKEENVWDGIKDKEVSIVTEDGKKHIKVKNIENFISGRNPIIKGLREMDDQDVIDITEIEKNPEIFVGRKKEIKELENLLKKVKKEGAKTLMIKGEAGVGKTSLVLKFRPFAEELGFEFLSGKCQSESSDPYLPFKDAFTEYLEEGPKEQKGASMAFIGTPQNDNLDNKNLFDAQKKETFFETTKRIRRMASENPLLIFLDDLQWVDKATLDILTYMDDKLDDSPVLFLGTYRPEDISNDHHLSDMIHRLDRQDRLEKIQLEPLTLENTEDIIKGVLGEEDILQNFIEIVHEKTEGNPLFIKESIRQMIEQGKIDVENGIYPDQSEDISVSGLVHNVIGRRINRLDKETIKVLEIGSVIGETIPFDLLSKTAEMNEIDLLDHIDMLTGNRLWDEDLEDEKFYFSHELIEDTIYQNIRGLKKRLLHKKVAENIESLHEDDLEDWYSDLARHHRRAENHTEALDYYIKGGKKAENVYANEDAIEMYEKALELCDEADIKDVERLEIIKKITKAYSLLGEYDKTKDYLERALESTEDPGEKQKIYRRIAKIHYEQADWDRSLEYIEMGLSEYKQEREETCRLLSLKGMVYVQKGDYDRAEQIFEKEKEVAESIGSEESMGQVYHDIGTTALRKGEIDSSIKRLQKAIDIREKTDNKIELQKSYNNLGIAYADAANFEKAEKYYKKSLEVCKDIGDKTGNAASLNNLGTIQMKKGDLYKAIDTFEESFDISKKLGDKHGMAIALSNLANIFQTLGDFESAESSLVESHEIADEIGAKNLIATNLSIRGTLNKKKGHLKEAKQMFLECNEVSKEIGNRMSVSISFHEMGEIELLRGNYEDSKEYYLRSKEVSEKLGAKELITATSDGLARVNRRDGDLKRAIELNKKGLEIAREADDFESIIANQNGLAECFYHKKNIEKSEEYSDKAKENLEGRENPEEFIRYNLIAAKIQMEKEHLDDAKSHLRNSIEKSKDVKNKIWESKSIFEQAILSLKQRNYEDAKEYFNRSKSMFQDIGMTEWRNKAESKLDEIK